MQNEYGQHQLYVLFLAQLHPFSFNAMVFKQTGLCALVVVMLASTGKSAHAQSPDSTLRGQPASLSTGAAEPAKQPLTIRIACGRSIPASQSPLFVVDGTVYAEQEFQSINPNNIDKIEVLRGAAATALYGSRASNGVILVTMKHRPKKPIYRPQDKTGRPE
ncbi:TonB-dependent receptor plug domain-containing protein [Hymenobacter sp. 5317J-9]|uniref:TonB-dependent receptor plug domain-containing protein n=1 Tax=Hymenobacter sp. 5317J-9 TaxID=2932250 RepID=UPI001FD6618A|nr:TonB-dependent receptor plug domain-containing protein [Hymenobacter sp. 5317J-9]UOQ96078.1 TonB-dependent receptor plug domain-containing protein [Hymenobacter sp. 5317J-9]